MTLTYTSVAVRDCVDRNSKGMILSPLASLLSWTECTPVVVIVYMRQWQWCSSVYVNSEGRHSSEPMLRGWICHQALSLPSSLQHSSISKAPGVRPPVRPDEVNRIPARNIKRNSLFGMRLLTQLYNNKHCETYHRSQFLSNILKKCLSYNVIILYYTFGCPCRRTCRFGILNTPYIGIVHYC